jgi:hypothetical protein
VRRTHEAGSRITREDGGKCPSAANAGGAQPTRGVRLELVLERRPEGPGLPVKGPVGTRSVATDGLLDGRQHGYREEAVGDDLLPAE